MNGEGDVHSVGGLGEVVYGLFGGDADGGEG